MVFCAVWGEIGDVCIWWRFATGLLGGIINIEG
jgi:hypothetical protein